MSSRIIILTTFLFLLHSFNVAGQKVIFCESVDSFGNPKNESTEFKIGEKGGFIKVLVKLNKKVNSKSAVFDIYKIEKEKKTLNNSIKMNLNPSLTWFYKEITFFQEGEYEVFVYDEKDKLLGVGKLTIKLR